MHFYFEKRRITNLYFNSITHCFVVVVVVVIVYVFCVATKLTQPMQFPTHMVPTPNHAMMTPNYMMNQKVYPQSAPVGYHPPLEFPQQNKEIEINKHGGISVFFE